MKSSRVSVVVLPDRDRWIAFCRDDARIALQAPNLPRFKGPHVTPRPLVFLAMCFAFAASARGQLPPPQSAPEDLGLRIPAGAPAKEGSGERVMVPDASGEPQVAEVFLEVGDTWVVTMPDGRLRSIAKAEAPAVDRPYAPLKKQEMLSSLQEQFPGFQTKATNRYVFVYNTSTPFFQATSRILETMYPALFAYCKRQQLSVSDPKTPLVVVMFRTQQEYQTYRKMPPEIVAYYNSVNNYVILYEQSDLAQTAPTLAIKQSISTIAHEGVHQILHNIGVQKRLSNWPMWISEGLPEFFAPTDIGRRVRWSGLGKVNNMRMRALKEYFATNPAETRDGGLVRQTVAADELSATGYAAAWAITDYLAKNRQKEFFAFLREVSQAKPLDEAVEPVVLFEKHFGDEYAKLQEQLIAHLNKLPYVDPILNQPHFLAVLDTGALRQVMVTSSPAAVQEWKNEKLSALPLPARPLARFTVRVFANRALAQQAAQAVLD